MMVIVWKNRSESTILEICFAEFYLAVNNFFCRLKIRKFLGWFYSKNSNVHLQSNESDADAHDQHTRKQVSIHKK